MMQVFNYERRITEKNFETSNSTEYFFVNFTILFPVDRQKWYVENYLLYMKFRSSQTRFIIKQKVLFCVLLLVEHNNTRKLVEFRVLFTNFGLLNSILL